jgi:hypothetical protein
MNNQPGVVVHVCNPSTWEAEAKEWGVRGQLGLPSEFKGSLSHPVQTSYLSPKEMDNQSIFRGLSLLPAVSWKQKGHWCSQFIS